MIVDSSAVIALIEDEKPYSAAVAAALAGRPARMGAPSAVECLIVLTARHGPVGRTVFERLRAEVDLGVVDVGAEHVIAAHRAYVRFGKGRHPAALNYGDCMTYGLAAVTREPLLAVGKDFAQTDLDFGGGVVGHWPTA